LPSQLDERLTIARRLVAERCLYGVDINPLAVELAKLSIWLVTLAKDRPFGFLNHNLRYGDSLLGIHRLEQLIKFSMTPMGQGQLRLFGRNIERIMREAIELRQQLREIPIRDIRDVEAMAHLDTDVRRRLEVPQCIADAFIGEVFVSSGKGRGLENKLATLAIQAGQAIDGDRYVLASMRQRSSAALSTDLPDDKPARRPFHWPLEFPEVFLDKNMGFSVVVGNPPFAEGGAVSLKMMSYLKNYFEITDCSVGDAPSKSTKINLITAFVERILSITHFDGQIGFIFPKPLLKNESYWRARQYLLTNSSIRFIYDFQSDAFRSASVETGAIVAIKTAIKNNKNALLIDFKLPERHVNIDINEAFCDKYFVIRTEITGNARSIFESIEKEKISLESYFESKDGINPGRRDFRSYFLGRKEGNDFVANASPNSKHWLAIPEPFDEGVHKKTINGRNFSEYSKINWDGTYLRYADRFAYIEEFFVKGSRWSAGLRKKTHFDRDIKVVSRQTASTLITTIDEEQYFPLNSVHVHFPKEGASDFGYNCFVLCGILNSKLMRFYYRIKSQETGKIFPQVHLSKLKQLPIPPVIQKECSLELEKLVKTAIYQGPSSEISSQIDELVCSLFDVDEVVMREIQESTEGLHADAAPQAPFCAPRTNHATSARMAQPSFDFDATSADDGASPTHLIEEYLKTHPGWHAKADVLAAIGITNGQWNAAIADLIARGKVERQGERRGARYRTLETREATQ